MKVMSRIRTALVFTVTMLALLAPALHGAASHQCGVGAERASLSEFDGSRALDASNRNPCGACLVASQLRSKLATLAFSPLQANARPVYVGTGLFSDTPLPLVRYSTPPRAPPSARPIA